MLPKIKWIFLNWLLLVNYSGSAQGQETRLRKYAANNRYACYDIRKDAVQGWYKEFDTAKQLIAENRIILPQDSNDIGANRIKSGLQKLYFTNGVCAFTAFFWSNRQIGPSLSRYYNGLPKCLHYSYGLELFWLPDSSLLYCKKNNAINSQVSDTILDDNQLKNIYKTLLQTDCLKLIETERQLEVYSFENEKVFSCGMKNGDLHGPFAAYSSKAALFENGYYFEASPCGEWNYYQSNKNVLVKQISYSKQLAAGALPLLEQEYNLETGQISKINRYKNGLLNGWQCTYHPNGMIADSFFVKNGISVGRNYSLQINGLPFRVLNYNKNGKQSGLNRYWFMPPYGNQLMEEVNYKNGLRHGKAKYYYPNGKLKLQGNYKEDIMQKTWSWFDTSGSVLAEILYINGKKINRDSLWVCHDAQASQRFINALESVIDLDSVYFAPWEFTYLAPIWPLVKNCFADYLDFGGRENAYFFDLIAFEPMYLEIPKKGGIQLLLNPCWHLGEQMNIPTSVTWLNKSPEETNIRMEPKKLAYVFPHFLKDANGKNFSLLFNLSELQATPIEMNFEGVIAKLPDTCFIQHSPLQLVVNSAQINAPQRDQDEFFPLTGVKGFMNLNWKGKVVSFPISDLRLTHHSFFLSMVAPEANSDIDWCSILASQFVSVEHYEVAVKKEMLDGKLLLNIEMNFK